jgi:hypothetical protein
MKTIAILLLLAFGAWACTIRVEPLKPKVKYVYRHPHHKKKHRGSSPPPAEDGTLRSERYPVESDESGGDVKLLVPNPTPPPP